MTHTPGPWEVTDYGVEFEGARFGEVAFVVSKEREQFEATEANARLIAAAPDLLSALEDFISALDGGAVNYDYLAASARAAIAKARGETQ